MRKTLAYGLSLAGIAGGIEYLWRRDQDYHFIFKKTEFNTRVAHNLDSIFKNFHANLLLYWNPLIANIYMGKVQDEYFPNGYEREYLEIKQEEATITLDWAKEEGSGKIPNNPKTLIIIHGLTGASESGYIKRACKRAIIEGFVPVVVQKRGYNSTRMTSPRLTPPDNFVDFIEST